MASISFIIPAYNEERLLGHTLRAIQHATRALDDQGEILVVEHASTDRTAAIAHEHGARVVAVKCRQIAATRNAGAREATGEMLVFVDADTIVTEVTVRAAIAAMRQCVAVRWVAAAPFALTAACRFMGACWLHPGPSLPNASVGERVPHILHPRGVPRGRWVR